MGAWTSAFTTGISNRSRTTFYGFISTPFQLT
jgi:hypothetical protein